MTEHVLRLSELARSLAGGAHSIFSASGSSMWAACSGSLIPNLLAADDSGEEAAEGTVAHAVGEEWLRSGKKPRHLIGTFQTVQNGSRSFTIEITNEMMYQVQRYVDWCWEEDGEHFTETRVNYDDLTPIEDQGGTCDHAVCRNHHLTITDLKYGKGVQVFAKDNPQIYLYAYGFFREWDWLYDFKTITVRICQPRLDHFDVWTITRDELLAFAAWIKDRAVLAWQIDAPRTPGDKQCTFCKVKGTCAAWAVYIAKMTDGVYTNLDEPVTTEEIDHVKDRIDFMERFNTKPPAELDLTQLSILYSWRGSVEGWFNAIHEELTRRVKAGQRPPFQKLVESRSHRTYANERNAMRYLIGEAKLPRKRVVLRSLPSPADLERLMRELGMDKKQTEAHLAAAGVIKPAGKPTLAHISDRRDDYRDRDAGVYSDLDASPVDDPETL